MPQQFSTGRRADVPAGSAELHDLLEQQVVESAKLRATNGETAQVERLERRRMLSAAVDMPYLGTPFAPKQTILAVDYDKGGQGVAYHDSAKTNLGGDNLRAGDVVGIQKNGSADVIAYSSAGEWLNYTIDVPTAGTYTLEASVADLHSGAAIHASVGGKNLTGTVTIPNTGSWTTYTTITTANFSLNAGTQVLQLDFDKNDTGGGAGNVYSLEFVPAISSGGTTTPPVVTPPVVTPPVVTPPSTNGTSADISPIISIKNTVNENTSQLIAPAITPAPTVTITGSNGGNPSAPTPVITELDPQGVTPHTVFVHALDSILGAGTPLTARYQWNFGDPGSEYNTLVGWNAAHTYDNPGVYTITLTLTNQLNETRILSTTVTEGLQKYTRSIYVDSVAGNDSNLGTSPSSPIKTIARASQLMGSNTELLFHAGETFPDSIGMGLPYQNILVGSYGTGANPVLMREPGNGSSHFGLLASSQDIVIQDITFDSVYLPAGASAPEIPANGVALAGVDITIRNCTFLNLDYAITEAGNPQGVLVQDNTAPLATGLRGYLVWGQGTDQVIVGNYDANSTRQHDIRTVDTIRQLIAYNNLTNLDRRSLGDGGDYSKGSIEIHRGSYAYVSNNFLYDGDLRVGPRYGPSVFSGDSNQWDVIEGNHTSNLPFEIFPGTSHVMVRNNIFSQSSGPLISITPQNSAGDNIADISFDNNTGISPSIAGQFIQIGYNGARGAVSLINNLWLAPEIIPGEHMDAAIFIEAPTASVLSVSAGNVWQMPATFNRWAHGGINYVNTSWNPPYGYYTPAAWDAQSNVNQDQFSATVVTANYTPVVGSVAATAGQQTYGMFVDIYGNPRPATGPISAGAVQTPGVV